MQLIDVLEIQTDVYERTERMRVALEGLLAELV
jgi:hypothetical protein